MFGSGAFVAAMLLQALKAAPQTAPDPHRPAAIVDSTPPVLPVLRGPAILIFSKTSAYRHDSIPDAVAAVKRLAEARGFSSFATENAAVFNREQLARFDVVVFANATGDMFTPAQRAEFQAWVATGRGFIGLHGAGDGSHAPWYQAMLGYSGYAGHPGGADQFQTGDLILTDRTHPATSHLPERWRWTEEYYAYSAPPGADTKILARLDESGMRLEPRHRMGDKHALIWWRCEGRTRVFYSALGHSPEAWRDPTHLRMVDGALRWAAGREGLGCR